MMGVTCLLAGENFAFCDLKMLNFMPYFSLDVSIHNDLGGCTTTCLRNFAFGERNKRCFRPFVNLNF